MFAAFKLTTKNNDSSVLSLSKRFNTDVRGIYLTYFMKLFMKDLYIAILCSRGQTPAN